MGEGDTDQQAELPGERSSGQTWGTRVGVPLLAALLGGVIGVGGSVYVADRQLSESRHEVEQQIAADRIGRLSDARAATYGQFVSAVDRHLAVIGDPAEVPIRRADEDISAAVRLVQLRGSSTAYGEANDIASRARALTNSAIDAIQRNRPNQGPSRPFFAQQNALDRFVHDVQPDLRK